MANVAPKVRDDLEYYEQVIDGEDMILVRDPVRNQWFRYNVLQAAMLQSLDGRSSPAEITAALSAQFEVEIPPSAAERFIARARELLLLDISAYETTPERARKAVKKALSKAGFRERSPDNKGRPRVLSAESMLFAEAFRQLDLGHPRAAAGYLAQILEANPNNARARQLYDLIQAAYLKACAGGAEIPSWVMFNPSNLLTWLSQTIGRFVFSWMGVLAIIALVALGLHAYQEIAFERIQMGPLDIAVAFVTLMIAMVFHELGHGLACQHYGGNVTEIGFMLFYYLQPAAFCDTSSSYVITERRHKMIIQLAGSTASIVFMAGHAILLALLSPALPIYPGLALAFVVSFALAFMTLLPFLKNDGYYAICDYFGFPNLRDRSFALARAWLGQRLFGLTTPTEEFPPRTRRVLILYAIFAFTGTSLFIYVLYFRFLAPVVERFGGAGLAFAVLATALMLRGLMLRPLWRGMQTLWRERRTVFTLRRGLAMLVVLAALVGPWFLHWPVLVDGTFVIVPHQRADVRAQTTGRIEEILVNEGDRVRAGDPVARLRNPDLSAKIAMVEAERALASFVRDRIRRGARPEELELARNQLARARAAVSRSTTDVANASKLAQAALGTQSRADTARVRAAGDRGEAKRAAWQVSLLEAGARPEDLAVAEAELARIDGELAHLREEEARLTLRSPIDGVVATPHLDEKLQQQLAPGDLFLEVHEQSAVVAEISLSMSDPLSEISVGDEVALRPRGVPGQELVARVHHVRELADERQGKRRIIVVTTPFAFEGGVSGLTGHARIYGEERTLAYAHLYLPLQRLVRIQLWSMY